MKFWQKIFLGIFIIFVIIIDIDVFVFTSYAYDLNLQRETDSSIREQNVILSSVANGILNAEKVYPGASENKERLTAIIKPLSDYYQQQDVLLALFENGSEIYSNIFDINPDLLNLETVNDRNVMNIVMDNKRFVLVASQIPGYPDLDFIYARDISQIDDFRYNVNRVLFIMNAIIFIVLGVSIYLLLKHMTQPITKLNEMTSEIAGGAYEKRIIINRGDELGNLGESFNRMADSVEENMVRLTKSAEEKQQFIDDLTHEMKTPLTAVLGYSEYLQNAKVSEKERIIAAGHLRSASLRLKNLSDKLREIVFLRNEKIQLEKVDISDLFSALTEMMHPILESRNLKFTKLAEIDNIQGDEILLLSMLTNLVENATRASKPGDTVTVKAYKNDYPVIEVTDTGRGMCKQEIEKVTAPFYRVDKSRSREFGGVGLGLSIVSQIAGLHNAKLEIESEPDVGTTVRIHFTTQ